MDLVSSDQNWSIKLSKKLELECSSFIHSFIIDINEVKVMNRTGVAKLFDSPSHFSKFEIVREPQLNSYLKGMQTNY